MKLAVIVVKPWIKYDKTTGKRIEEFDKNGVLKEFVIFEPIAGEVPMGKNIMLDWIAASNHFELGKRYEVLIEEKEPNESYGRNFKFHQKGEWFGTLKAAITEYGEPKSVDTRKADTFLTIG